MFQSADAERVLWADISTDVTEGDGLNGREGARGGGVEVIQPADAEWMLISAAGAERDGA